MFKDKDKGYTLGAFLHEYGLDINLLKDYIRDDGYQLLKVANKPVEELQVVDGCFHLSSSEMEYISPEEGRVSIEVRPASTLLIICTRVGLGVPEGMLGSPFP